ncbi:MAG: hypothetical protein EOM65_11810 [Synergistales bacterium]|nr:hypothetical protein [Synergistales bacterium]
MEKKIKNFWNPLFRGFYCTDYDPMDIELSKEQVAYAMGKPEDKVTDRDMNEVYDRIDYDAYKKDIVKKANAYFIGLMNTLFKERGTRNFSAADDALYSPREYNFENDRAEMTLVIRDFDSFAKKVEGFLNDEGTRPYIDKRVKEDFTSRDGFMSFYPNDVREWGDRWKDDMILMRSLILYIMESRGFDGEGMRPEVTRDISLEDYWK